ncbi:MAG: hypothetical protein WAU39_12095 [Polyangiales bacterium]
MRWFIAISLLLALACSKKEAPPPAESEQATETEAETLPSAEGAGGTPAAGSERAEPAQEGTLPLPEELQGETPALGAAPVLKVLEQGSEPRQALRWKVGSGFTQKLSADVDSTADALVSIVVARSPQYTVSYDLALHAKKVEKDGTVHVAFSVDEATPSAPTMDSNPKLAKRLKEALPAVRRVTGTYRMSPRGRVTDLQVKVPPNATPTCEEMIDSLRWALTHWVPLFPEVPIGKDAEWTIHQAVEQNGVRVNQLRGYRVVKIDGNRVELGMSTRQSATAQRFTSPGTAGPLDLAKLEGQATGSMTWNLTELGPRTASFVMQVVRHATSVPAPGKESVPVTLNNTHSVKVGEPSSESDAP